MGCKIVGLDSEIQTLETLLSGTRNPNLGFSSLKLWVLLKGATETQHHLLIFEMLRLVLGGAVQKDLGGMCCRKAWGTGFLLQLVNWYDSMSASRLDLYDTCKNDSRYLFLSFSQLFVYPRNPLSLDSYSSD